MRRVPRFLIDFVDLVLWVVETFLFLRFVLRLFGANPESPFIAFLYGSTTPLLEPFRGMFPIAAVEPGMVVEFSTLFAMIIYALFAYLIIELIDWMAHAPSLHRGPRIGVIREERIERVRDDDEL